MSRILTTAALEGPAAIAVGGMESELVPTEPAKLTLSPLLHVTVHEKRMTNTY